jgi:RNA polymerase sigma-54 factor
MKSGLTLRTTQQLTLTPQLQQSIRLLQLSSIELEQEIEQALADNPLLERVEDEEAAIVPDAVDDETPAVDAYPDAAPEAVSLSAQDPAVPEDDAALPDAVHAAESGRALDDWPLQLDEGSGGWQESDEAAPEAALPSAPPRLQDHLHAQASALRLSEEERAALYLLIESLDDDGYLRDPLEHLADALLARAAGAADRVGDTAERAELLDLLRRALAWLQAMEPAGVGARDLCECLRLQLRDRAAEPAAQAALALCGQPLEWIARRDLRRLSAATGLDEERLRAGLALLARLEPKPGRRFARTDAQLIVPDVIVHVHGTRFDVQLNPAVLPRLRVADLYAQALARQPHTPLHQRLQEARWLIKNLQQRFDTILRVARAIVERQRSFFLHGPVGMRPLMRRDIADALGLHESTISRATTGKYMATPQGTFELGYFFGSRLATDGGDGASSTAVRALIQQMIAEEDPRSPLSDGALAERLKEHGIECARRTVAKYREALRIPPAPLRKSR